MSIKHTRAIRIFLLNCVVVVAQQLKCLLINLKLDSSGFEFHVVLGILLSFYPLSTVLLKGTLLIFPNNDTYLCRLGQNRLEKAQNGLIQMIVLMKGI